MSASSKKKLRNAEQAAQLTERQLQEQKEAKKLKTYSAIFVAVLALMIIFAAYSAVSGYITNSGSRERKNIAMTVGSENVSSAELNFYYMDQVNNFYSTYGSMASLFGMDLTKPLNEQVTNEETGTTWADDFLESAKTTAQSVIALCQEAEKAGFTLTEEEIAAVDEVIEEFSHHAADYGFASGEEYIKAIYGNGATEKLMREYIYNSTLASAYQNFYNESLSYDDAAIRAGEGDHAAEYNGYNYNVYTIATDNFLEHELNEDGTESHDHSTEDQTAAADEAKAVAEELAAGTYASAEEFDAAIAALPMNAEKENAASTKYEDTQYDNITSLIKEWVTDSQRKAGDITCIANTTTADDGTETVSSYYVVLFGSVNDNVYPMNNVRHILVSYEGGTTDENGTPVYSDAEKAAALEQAEALLKTWQDGDATEESFMALAAEKSTDTGSAAEGGLIANITKHTSLVENFLNWSIDESRKPGDTGIVESTYGYHVMFYSGKTEQSYRDYMIENDLRAADLNNWLTQIKEAMPVTIVDLSLTPMDMILQSA